MLELPNPHPYGNVIPINVDINATKNDYKHLLPKQLLMTKCFYTVQGEGPFAGQTSIFVRLAGCNIGAKQDCPWCDTAFQLADGQVIEGADTIMGMMRQVKNCGLVVLTGGEPLLQWSRITQVIADVDPHFGIRRKPMWQFETNGLLLREDHIDFARRIGRIHYVVSPKIAHSRSSYHELPELWKSAPELVSLKYVVSADPESEYHELPEDCHGIENDVYVSGMTVYKRPCHPGEVATVWDDTLVDQKATARNYKWAARLALEHGLKLSLQTHLFGGVE